MDSRRSGDEINAGTDFVADRRVTVCSLKPKLKGGCVFSCATTPSDPPVRGNEGCSRCGFA